MGKKSVKKNKNIYQICREGLELTRERASELLETISADRRLFQVLCKIKKLI